MIKIRLGGWLFKVKNKWPEVTFEEAQRLANTDQYQIRERVKILISPGLPDSLKVNNDHLLALYEICSFVQDIPELVPNTIEVPDVKTWPFKVFEFARHAITKHPEELALSFPRITEVLDLDKSKYLEVGAKAVDMINIFTSEWAQWGIFDESEPSQEELNAGIERLQSFGVFGMIDRLATKYGVTPEEVENWPTQSVFMKWVYLLEESNFQAELQRQAK